MDLIRQKYLVTTTKKVYKSFRELPEHIQERLGVLLSQLAKQGSVAHSIVFDRGNNSKNNLALIKEAGLHYVGARKVFTFTVEQSSDNGWTLIYERNADKVDELQEEMGLRIIITDRHDRDSSAIIQAYHGQSFIEGAFRNMKNPYHNKNCFKHWEFRIFMKNELFSMVAVYTTNGIYNMLSFNQLDVLLVKFVINSR